MQRSPFASAIIFYSFSQVSHSFSQVSHNMGLPIPTDPNASSNQLDLDLVDDLPDLALAAQALVDMFLAQVNDIVDAEFVAALALDLGVDLED